MSMLRTVAALAAAGLLAACAAGVAVSPVPTAPPVVTPTPTSRESAGLVGTWLGVHDCQRIFDLMTGSGMPEQALLNIVDAGVLPGVEKVSDIADPAHPCAGAVDIKHSHFFTAGGIFGSRDANGRQVDDGHWSIVDGSTFEIGGVQFHYQVAGDTLRMEPVSVGSCPTNGEWCQEAWKLMVAMPGMAWTRG